MPPSGKFYKNQHDNKVNHLLTIVFLLYWQLHLGLCQIHQHNKCMIGGHIITDILDKSDWHTLIQHAKLNNSISSNRTFRTLKRFNA